jgi:DNA-binding MarR family transcriptional regulator
MNVIDTKGRKVTNKARILAFLSAHGDRHFTRNEIAEFIGIRLPTVCSAVDALLDDALLVEVGERSDYYTEARAKTLTATYYA